jgi:hypothetical protein
VVLCSRENFVEWLAGALALGECADATLTFAAVLGS